MPVIVVTGPPCSGKSTHVAEHAGPLDVVVDLDAIAHALGYPAEHIDWAERPAHPARAAAMTARAAVIRAALGKVTTAGPTTWIIDAIVAGTAAARYRAAGARVVALDPGRAECLRRAEADGRPAATLEQIRRWYGGAELTTSARW